VNLTCERREDMECEGLAPLILNIGTDGCEWSVTHPGRFTSGERVPSTL